jgi:hypothetical protein
VIIARQEGRVIILVRGKEGGKWNVIAPRHLYSSIILILARYYLLSDNDRPDINSPVYARCAAFMYSLMRTTFILWLPGNGQC